MPPTDATAELYEGGTYAPARRSLERLLDPLRRLTEVDRMRFVSGVPDRGRVLEVGAGDGRFLARLAARGYAVSGIEPSPSARALARGRGLEIADVPVERAPIAPASQDAVFLWHVLEHLDNPAAVLGRVRSWLAPSGVGVVACPNLASLQARIGADAWFHQDVPRHRTHFTAHGLALLLERVGFRVVRVHHVVIEHNALGMWQTMLNRLTRERDFAFRFIKRDLESTNWRDVAVTAVAGPLLAPFAAALELCAGLAARGGTVVVEATPSTQGRAG